MKTTLVVVGILNIAAFLLVVLNRSSEKVVTSYLSISVGALAGIVLAIWAFADQGKIELRFPVAFFVDPTDKQLVQISTRFDVFQPNDAAKHAADFADPGDQFGVKAYHLALQRVLVEWMIRTYWHTWRVESVHYETPGPWELRTQPIEGADEHSTILTLQDIAHLFPAGSAPHPYAVGMIDKIALPPGLFGRRAELAVTDPHKHPQFGDTADISIQNDFCKLTFTTRSLGGRRGLGEYGALAGLHEDEEQKYAHVLYEIIARATYTPWLAGHPEMPKYKRWAASMIEMMRDTFDEQRILQRSRDAVAHAKFLPAPERPKFPPVSK